MLVQKLLLKIYILKNNPNPPVIELQLILRINPKHTSPERSDEFVSEDE